MQTLGNKGAIRSVELRNKAIDVKEWPHASDFLRGVRRLIRPAELGIGGGKSGMVEIVARACAEARPQRRDGFLVASIGPGKAS